MQVCNKDKRLFFGMLIMVLISVFMMLFASGCTTSRKLVEKSEYHEITEKKVEIGEKVMWSDTIKIELPIADSHKPIADSQSPEKQSISRGKTFKVEQDGKKAEVDIFYKTTIDSNKVITTIESLNVEFDEKKEIHKTSESSETKKSSTFWRTAAFFMGGLSLAILGLYLLRIFIKR